MNNRYLYVVGNSNRELFVVYEKTEQETVDAVALCVGLNVITSDAGRFIVVRHDIPKHIDKNDVDAVAAWGEEVTHNAVNKNDGSLCRLVKCFDMQDCSKEAEAYADMKMKQDNERRSNFNLLDKKLGSGDFSPLDFGCPDINEIN
jgi:hypothetical protein